MSIIEPYKIIGTDYFDQCYKFCPQHYIFLSNFYVSYEKKTSQCYREMFQLLNTKYKDLTGFDRFRLFSAILKNLPKFNHQSYYILCFKLTWDLLS